MSSMKNDVDQLLDLQIEVVQVSIYCEIIKKIIARHQNISALKMVVISFIIKKRLQLKSNIYRGNNKVDILLKFLSLASGLFDELSMQLPYILESIDLLVKDQTCEIHEGEIICTKAIHISADDFDAFTESAIQESKTYSDRQFLKEVISIV